MQWVSVLMVDPQGTWAYYTSRNATVLNLKGLREDKVKEVFNLRLQHIGNRLILLLGCEYMLGGWLCEQKWGLKNATGNYLRFLLKHFAQLDFKVV